MEAFIRINSFTLILILYLIVTSDLPPGAYCTNPISLTYSTHNSALHALNAINDTNFLYNFGGLSSSLSPLLPVDDHGPPKFPSNEKSPKLTSPTVPSVFANKESSLTSSSIFPSTELEKTSGPERSGGSDISSSSSYNIATKAFSSIAHPITSSRRRRTADIGKVQMPPTYSSPFPAFVNSDTSSSSQRNDGNSFRVAYLMNVLYGLAPSPTSNSQDGGSKAMGGNSAERISFGSNNFSGRFTTNDIIRRGGRRRRSDVSGNDNDEHVSIATKSPGNERDFGNGVTEATTVSTTNNNNDDNEDFKVTPTPSLPPSSSPLPQASGILSEVTTSIPLPPQESSSAPLQSKDVANDNDSGGNATNELFNITTTTPEPGTTPLRGRCNDTSQCSGEYVECRLGICKCELGYLPRIDNGELCGEASAHHVEIPTTDPTMIGVVVGLALMSVTLCIVLRLFAKARFRENRTIFNTPNPRLMNVSLLKGSKTLLRGNSGGGQRSRRGSQASIGSGQDGQSPPNPDGNGVSAAAGSSSHPHPHPHRVKPSRTLSTDTNNLEGTPTSEGRSSRPVGSANKGKYRQDSVASNV